VQLVLQVQQIIAQGLPLGLVVAHQLLQFLRGHRPPGRLVVKSRYERFVRVDQRLRSSPDAFGDGLELPGVDSGRPVQLRIEICECRVQFGAAPETIMRETAPSPIRNSRLLRPACPR